MRCTRCTSTRFRLADNGFYTCHRGHQVQMGVDERQDEDNTAARPSRSINARKNKRTSSLSENDSLPDESLTESMFVFKSRVIQWIMETLAKSLCELFPSNSASISNCISFVLCLYISHAESNGSDICTSDSACLVFISLSLSNAVPSIIPQDILNWILTSKIPYLNLLYLLPAQWKPKFNQLNMRNFTTLKSGENFHLRILDIIRRLNSSFGFKLPSFAMFTFLNSFLSQLSLPVDLFSDKILRLSSVLDIDLNYLQLTSGLPASTNLFPHVQIVSLIFVLIQLYYDADSNEFFLWLQDLEKYIDSTSLNPSDISSITSDDEYQQIMAKLNLLKFLSTPSSKYSAVSANNLHQLTGNLISISDANFSTSNNSIFIISSIPFLLQSPNTQIVMFHPKGHLARFCSMMPSSLYSSENDNRNNTCIEYPGRLLALLVLLSKLIGVSADALFLAVCKTQNEICCSLLRILDILNN